MDLPHQPVDNSLLVTKRNDQLSEFIQAVANSCKRDIEKSTVDECTSFDQLMDRIKDSFVKKSKPIHIFRLSDHKWKGVDDEGGGGVATCDDYNSFVADFQNLAHDLLFRQVDLDLDSLKKILDDLLLLWCLEKIDPTLPAQVREVFGTRISDEQMSLKDLQTDIFLHVQIVKEKQGKDKQEVTADTDKIKEEEKEIILDNITEHLDNITEQILEEDTTYDPDYNDADFNEDLLYDYDNVFSCEVCEQSFSTLKKLNSHKKCHKTEKKRGGKKKKIMSVRKRAIKCPICDSPQVLIMNKERYEIKTFIWC